MGSVTQIDIDGTNYDIFGTVAEALEYFTANVADLATWTGYGDDDQKRYLVSAARVLDRQAWEGKRTSSSQPRSWPREGATDRDGNAITNTTVPDDICHAGFELAIAIGRGQNVEGKEVSTSGETRRTRTVVGPVTTETEFFDRDRLAPDPSRFPLDVEELVRPYLASALGVGIVKSSGTGEASLFDDDQFLFNRSRGFN